MLDFMIKYQRFLMLFLQGACFFVAFLILITNSLCAKRKIAIFCLEVSAVLYLGAPIVHLSYDGFPGEFARWALLVSKSIDYLAPLFMLYSFNLYLRDLLSTDVNKTKRNSVRKLFYNRKTPRQNQKANKTQEAQLKWSVMLPLVAAYQN